RTRCANGPRRWTVTRRRTPRSGRPEPMVRAEKRLHPWQEPGPARPAATILLVRDSTDGIEVLMSRRSPAASFAPGAYVFPGGALDEADRAAAASRAGLRARDDQDPEEIAFAVAALREAF